MSAAHVPSTASAAQRWFWRIFWSTLAIKIAFAAKLPITGDEALFVQWGKRLSWGYYDHPPMTGWMLAALMQMGDSRVVIRLVTVFTTHLIGLGLVDAVRRLLGDNESERAWWVGVTYLLYPWSWFFVLVTTDTPVVLLMGFAAWCCIRWHLERRTIWLILCSVCLGLAFLSKYFAVLLGFAIFILVLRERDRRIQNLIVFTVPVLILVMINVMFNATHGWPNIMFNLMNRQDAQQWNLKSPGIFLGMMVYLLTPWLVWWLMRQRQQHATIHSSTALVPLLLWLVPLGFFGLVSFRREIGLHWTLGFVPFFMLWALTRLDLSHVRKMAAYTAIWALPHMAVVVAAIWWPLDGFKSDQFREKVVFFRDAPEITELASRDIPPHVTLMSTGYSTAAVLAYWRGAYVPVFGEGSKYARQDDLWTDFREFDGQDIFIFNRDALPLEHFSPFFISVDSRIIDIRGITYSIVHGRGFRFQSYKTQVLDQIHRRYFQIPSWLPVLGNPFCERYGYADCAPQSVH